jgi:hypothetical protein
MTAIFVLASGCSFFVSSFFRGRITELAESLHNLFGVVLVGIIGNRNSLIGDVGLNRLDTLFKAQVVFDFFFTTVAVHHRLSGDYKRLNVFG